MLRAVDLARVARDPGRCHRLHGDPIEMLGCNAHVLQPPNGGKVTQLTVVFANGDRVPAHVVAYNLAADVGLLDRKSVV